MTFDVNRIGAPAPPPEPLPAVLTQPGGNGFATVYDLTAKRMQADRPSIPDELWDEVDAAARTADEMSRTGHAMRFDVHRVDGKVIASLVDGAGSVVRPVSLSEVLDVGSVDPEDAA
jgi:hypothetical protein